jgi:phosphoglycolate phosphatase-like HAD superfamily hydrolase
MSWRLDLVIFDADGVLFESVESNIAYYNAIFKIIGEPALSIREEHDCVFMAASQVFALRAGGEPSRVAQMQQIGSKLDFTQFFKLLRPPLPLRPFLLELVSRYRLGLATNRSATVPAVLEYLEIADLFAAVASARDKVAPKPAPDMLKLCLERAAARAESAVYVGDSTFDHQAATAAGIPFIGLGSHVRCDNLIERLSDLPAVLERLSKTSVSALTR